ncbi:uncharacterized protein K441DRAFT_697512 [Cenococcum geophilum 1.58]|uniref:uncharacterized protein n=1 Tax=Cenococcum geophilum 1.58 TaxID=794803 RepID=UPI00358E3E05|nr:hypothetical protein K441DRAFT_697512 [Cenococcum geophilum 1.58]
MPYFPSLLTNKLKQFKYNHKHKRQENIRRNPRLKAPIRLLGNGLLDLTVSLSDAIVKITARNSIKSRLLHLPAEIRNRVFALALGGYHIHVFNDSLICDPPGSKAFGHTAEIITESTKKRKETPLKPKQSQVPNYVDPKFSNHVYADHNACFHPPNSPQCGDKSMTTVACTCRQIYAETALFYYELKDQFYGCFSKNPNAMAALRLDQSLSKMPFMSYTELGTIYVSKELLKNLYAPRCNYHGWYNYDVDVLDLEVRKKVLVRLCNRGRRELEAILQGSVEVIILD